MANVPGGIGYIFDIIIVRLDISDNDVKQAVDTDPRLLIVEATFNKDELRITSSRINVVEFKSGKSFEFVENPSVLKDDLSKNKLKLKIKHNDKVVGLCAMDWPASFLNCLTDAAGCGGELTQVFESEFKCAESDEKCGSIEAIVRLQIKCTEWNDNDLCGPQEDMTQMANKVIDPNDVLFVVGENKNPCCCSQVGIIPASDSDKSLNPTCLDLSNFRSVNGQTVPNTDVLNVLDPTCSKMKKVTNEYQKLLAKLVGPQKATECCSKISTIPTQHPNSLCCSNQKSNILCSSSSDSHHVTSPHHGVSDDGAFAGGNIINICHKDAAPDLTEQVPIRSRCCPLCNENLTWLPKLAACPKCGYKPIPQFEQRPYNDRLTADDILKDCLDKKASCSERASEQNPSKTDDDNRARCRCTCIPNKVCAYCRIRKLCADVFPSDPRKETEECGKCESKSSGLFNVCKTSSKDCRPHLTRVFSELKDLYGMRDVKKKEFQVDERCERKLNGEGVGRKSLLVSDKRVKEKVAEKSSTRQNDAKLVKDLHSSVKMCKNRKYNYRTVRKYPGTQIGHKTCINGYAGRKNVPSNMGWLWNVEATGRRAGWKPGAIRKPIKELMRYFLRDFPADTLRVSQYSYRRGGNGGGGGGDSVLQEELIQKPTLHICKKNGEYFITLRPLKDPEALRECADPYLNMQPIQFKIAKNPMAIEMRKLKQCLKQMGFNKCTCHRPIIYCFCRSFLDKKRLEYQCNKEARKRNLPACSDSLVLSDTTDSETEFDFGVTPPAGVVKPERLNKPNFVNTGTQYTENDWNVPPLYPKEPNKYMKLYNCAIGERFGKAFGPYGPGGYVPGATPAAGVFDGVCSRRSTGNRKGSGRGMGMSRTTSGKGALSKDKKGAGGGTVDMMKYLNKSKGRKLSPAELAEKRKKRLRELSGVAPPLICMVDRRAKALSDPSCGGGYCQPSMSCYKETYLHDNRIC